MSEHKIAEDSDEARRVRRSRAWELYDKYLNELDSLDAEKDPFQSESLQKVMQLSSHVFGAISRRHSFMTTNRMTEHDINEIREAHKPKWYHYTLLAVQVVGAVGGAAAPFVPGAAISQAAKQAIGAGITGVTQTGSQTALSFVHAHDQNNQSGASFALEASKREQADRDHQEKESMRRKTDLQQNEDALRKKRSDTFNALASG